MESLKKIIFDQQAQIKKLILAPETDKDGKTKKKEAFDITDIDQTKPKEVVAAKKVTDAQENLIQVSSLVNKKANDKREELKLD